MPQLTDLGRWLGVSTQMEGAPDLGTLKATLAQRGVNARGWRLYLDHGDAMFKPFAHKWSKCAGPHACAAQAIGWLCVLQACEMDVLPPIELVTSIHAWDIPQDQLAAIPPLFLRAAWKVTTAASYEHAETDLKRFVAESVTPVAQWFFRSGVHKTTGPERLRAGWGSLKRLYKESLRKQARHLSNADWPPVIHRYASGPFVLVGLCQASELIEEGEAMNHCIGTYADTCRFEPLRIYSIRHKKSGVRVATLSVRETKPGRWDVDQLKGPFNADAGSWLWPEIDGLLQLLSKVSCNDTHIRRHLDLLHQLADD